MNKENKLDKGLFFTTMIFTILIVGLTVLMPEEAAGVAGFLFSMITQELGGFILVASLGVFAFLLWFAFSKYGKIKLGGADETSDFSYATYAFMMFTAGVGSSLIYWAIGEPLIYLAGNYPMYAENELEASFWAITYPIFHWGPTAWAIYCIPAIAFGYFLYNKKANSMKVSDMCVNVIGEKNSKGIVGYAINIFSIFATLAALSTSISFCVDLVSTGLNELFGIPNNFILQLLIVASFGLTFTFVVLAGLKKGVAKLSDTCTYLALAFGIYVLLVTNTRFTIDYAVDSIGIMLQNYMRLSTWLDPVGQSNFPQDWTVYYWAWFYAYFVMMGLFVSKISKGRTYAQMILTAIVCGSSGCAFFTCIFGGYAVSTHFEGIIPIIQIASEQGTSAAVLSLITDLPLGSIILVVFLLVQYFLLSTSITSAIYSLSMMSSKNSTVNDEPANIIKLAWAAAVVGMGMLSFIMGGDLTTIKSFVVISGLPMIIITILTTVSTMKGIKRNFHNAILLEDGTYMLDVSQEEL